MAPTWSSSEILGSARLSYPRSWAGAPVSRISASCLPLPWTCSITYSPHRSITPSSASSRPIPNRLSSFVTNLDIWPSTNSRRTSSIRLSPSATARSVPPSSPPTHRSPTGATYSSIRPSPRRSPTASSRTPRSSCSGATASVSPRIRIRQPSNCAGSDQAPRCGDIPGRRSPPGNPSTALPRAGGGFGSRSFASFPHMFNFSANHLLLLSRTEYPKCAVFLLRDLDTQRVYRLYDFTKALLLRPGVAYSVAGKVNSADKLYLVLESVRPDTKHLRSSNVLAPANGAGGSRIG